MPAFYDRDALGVPASLARHRQGGHPLRRPALLRAAHGQGIRRADVRAGARASGRSQAIDPFPKGRLLMNRNFWSCRAPSRRSSRSRAWSALSAQTAPAKIVVSSPTFKSMEVDSRGSHRRRQEHVAGARLDRRARRDARVRAHHGRPGCADAAAVRALGDLQDSRQRPRACPRRLPAGPASRPPASRAPFRARPDSTRSARANAPPRAPGYRGPRAAARKAASLHVHGVRAGCAARRARKGSTKAGLLKAMEGHIIGQGQLVGLYERKAPGYTRPLIGGW